MKLKFSNISIQSIYIWGKSHLQMATLVIGPISKIQLNYISLKYLYCAITILIIGLFAMYFSQRRTNSKISFWKCTKSALGRPTFLSFLLYAVIGATITQLHINIKSNSQFKIAIAECQDVYNQAYNSRFIQLKVTENNESIDLIKSYLSKFRINKDQYDMIIGYCLYKSKDYKDAQQYLKNAAKTSAYASWLFGYILFTGYDDIPQSEKGIEFIKNAADNNCIDAQYFLFYQNYLVGNYVAAENYAKKVAQSANINFSHTITYAFSLDEEETLCDTQLRTKYFTMYVNIYNYLLGYYSHIKKFDNAIEFLQKQIDNAKNPFKDLNDINIAIMQSNEGDRIRANRRLKKIANSNSGFASLARAYCVDHLLSYHNKDFSKIPIRNIKKAEIYLLQDMKEKRVSSMSRLSNLYYDMGYYEQYLEMDHLISFIKLYKVYEQE